MSSFIGKGATSSALRLFPYTLNTASLQQWVDDLYGRRKPKSAAKDLLIERRRAVDAEHAAVRKRQSKASPRR